MRRQLWRSAKWISLGVSIASIALAVVLMQSGGPKQTEPKQSDAEKPKTRVESPVIVERKEGQIVWQLRALEAKQQLDGQMHLSKPKLVLYTQSQQEVTIDSEEALFNPLRRDVSFRKNVLVRFDAWTLATEQMIYVSNRDEIHVPGAFRAWGKSIRAKGKNMRLHRTREELKVDGGIWIEDAAPDWQGVIQ